MDRSARFPWVPVWIGLLFALLPLLAWLQMSWIDALERSEAERLTNFVETGTDRVAFDLQRELIELDQSFHELGDDPRAWREQLARAPLVARVLRLDPLTPSHVLELDAVSGELRPTEWTSELQPWARVLESLDESHAILLPASPPARVVPLPGEGPPHLLLLVLDVGRLERDLLAPLVRRHLGQPFGPGIEVLVSLGGHVRLRSAGLAADDDLSVPDAVRRIEGGQLELAQDSRGALQVSLTGGAAAGLMERVELERTTSDPEPALGGTQRTWRLQLPVWELRARHPSGSVAAAVAGARRRNLALGLGVLAVLAAATGVLLFATQRARRLARQQIDFVAGVTHELRTPLTVIRSAAENLVDRVVEEPDQVRRYGELIHNEARRLSSLVEEALSLAGARGAQASSRRRPVDLAALLERVVGPRRAQRARGIQLEVPAHTPPVMVDVEGLERALDNLLANACKYAGAVADVGISVRVPLEGAVEVTVWDRGPGIPRHEQKRIFEPFFRGRSARASSAPGSGLGLSVVRRVVEAQGGSVRVQSEPGRGASFTLCLQRAQENPA